MEKHFIDPKRSEILSAFPCTTQIVATSEDTRNAKGTDLKI
jgi:hypothetical protein